MPNGDATAFPKFPSLFTPKDAERLATLEAQRKEIEQVFQAKFTPGAWAKVPAVEKAVRGFLPPWTAPLVKVVTPADWGWDFGFTPEQAQEKRIEIEEDYKELVRKQRVNKLVPAITETLRTLALTENIITDAGQLREIFKLEELGFNEDEIGYISSFAQRLIGATKEEIASGEIFEMQPLSPEDVEELAKRAPEPRMVQTSVALTKNLEDITDMLKEIYSPQVEPSEKEHLLEKYLQELKDSGITEEASRELFEQIKEQEGETIILTDESTGNMIPASLKPDGTVWLGDEPLGFYDADNKRVVPVSLAGVPLFTEEEQLGAIGDLWNQFYFGIRQAVFGTQQGLLSLFKEAISPKKHEVVKKIEEATGKKVVDIEESRRVLQSNRVYQDIIKAVDEQFEINQARFQDWLKENPEMQPKPEYFESPFENTSLWTDPGWYAHTILTNAPLLASALFVGIGTSLATRNPLLGATAGAAVITPAQINGVREDLIANGASPNEANSLAVDIGVLMGLVEIVPGLIALKAIAPAFMHLFRRNLQKEITRLTVRELAKKGIVTATKIEVAETLEEVIQEAMQNAAVQTVNEGRSLVDNLPETAVQAAIATLPLSIFGGGTQFVQMKSNLPQDIQNKINKDVKNLTDAGVLEDISEAVVIGRLKETETGRSYVEAATAQVIAESGRTEQETVLESINKDIDTFTRSIEVQGARLAKLQESRAVRHDVVEQTSLIEDLKNTLAELEIRKAQLDEQLIDTKAEDTIEELEFRELVSQAATRDIVVERIEEGDFRFQVTDGENITKTRNLEQARELVETGEVVSFPEAIEVEPTDARLQAGLPIERGVTTQEGRPRIQDWKDERESIRTSLEANPNVAKAIAPNKNLAEARETTERTINSLKEKQAELVESRADDEELAEVEKSLKAIAREARLNSNTLLARGWNDLTPPEQSSLALTSIPDRSIHFPRAREMFDIRYYMQFLQESTGLPFYNIFKRAELSHGAARVIQEEFLQRIGTDPHFSNIRTDEEALARVAQEINSRNPELKLESPEGLSENELMLANVIEDMYIQYQNKVRYLRVQRTTGTFEALKAEFPDAPEEELVFVEEMMRTGNDEDLWSFLSSPYTTWGVIGSGYDPWMVSFPALTSRKIRIGTTRGAARLMRRESVEFSELKQEKNVLLRLATYLKQVEAQWRIEPELDTLEKLWSEAGVKFSNLGQVESALREWTRELQGIPVRESFLDSVLRRLWRQAMSAVFVHPWMAFRNTHQPIAFHPDRSELPKLLTQQMPAEIKAKAHIYYDTFVSQLKGIRRDWLYTGEKGLPGLGWLTRLADRVSLYSHSDNIPRRWSFEASTNKALRATEQFRQDGDITKWMKESGVAHLRETERNYALELLTQETHDLAVPGLREVSGDEMVSFYIGHEVANMTHFIYERAFRAPVEYGSSGRTLYNLIVFPRGYFQRVYFQGQKMPKFNEVFSKDTNWEQARVGFKDILLLVLFGVMISEWLRKVTGKPRRAYNPADIIQWQLGGLVLGVGMDVTKMVSDVIIVLDPTADEDFKKEVMARLPGELVRNADVLIPFYRQLLDSFEAATDTKNIDTQALKQLRALLDEDYTPEEIEKLDRTLWEKLRKATLAGDVPDPTQFLKIQTDLQEAQSRLGEIDTEGRFYTLKNLYGDIRSKTKPLPTDMVIEDWNFSELVVFGKESEDKLKELYELPSSPASIRQDWRKTHLEEEAMLLFWGRYSKSVFVQGSPEWKRVSSLLRTWFSYYKIDRRMHSQWADWNITSFDIQ